MVSFAAKIHTDSGSGRDPRFFHPNRLNVFYLDPNFHRVDILPKGQICDLAGDGDDVEKESE